MTQRPYTPPEPRVIAVAATRQYTIWERLCIPLALAFAAYNLLQLAF